MAPVPGTVAAQGASQRAHLRRGTSKAVRGSTDRIARCMRRWLLILLLMVLPLQMVWGAAAPYCAHEPAAAGKRHFGHHEHKHAAASDRSAGAGEDVDGVGTVHTDCESCHLGCSATLPAVAVSIAAPAHDSLLEYRAPSWSSIIPRGPERPDRARPATAARFGGGVEPGQRTA